MNEAHLGQTSLEDFDIYGFDPHLSDLTSSGIGSDVGSDPLVDPGSTGHFYERSHHDSGVFSRCDSVGSDSNSVPSTSSVGGDYNYFNMKNSFTEDLTDGWKRLSVQRSSGNNFDNFLTSHLGM